MKEFSEGYDNRMGEWTNDAMPYDGEYAVEYFKDEEFGNTYTICMRNREDGRWFGWVDQEKKVTHIADTPETLVVEIKAMLIASLDADADAFDKQIEEDAKSGKLLAAFKAGKFDYNREDAREHQHVSS